ncbi:hypothetical protein [Pontimicrobium sp. SW4]|uniref:HEAT repeat domain-containing protein n=1 Tax=Pontimicrobium sp. SW4 TaxID=3153519 RepID=A0AAU7BQV4_9FLAO
MNIKNFNKKTFAIFLMAISTINVAFAQDYGVTVFGTDIISKEEVVKKCKDELQMLKTLYDSDRETYKTKKIELDNKLLTLGDFAYANVRLFKSFTNDYDFIIDFVEAKEAKMRLNYRTINTKHFDDPNGLIAKWQEYEELSYQLFKDGEIKDYSCPVIHCLWSFNHPKLEPYLDAINTYAPKHKDELINILNTSELADQRASAAFLLAHAEMNNEDLLQTLMPSIRDAESSVRNNSMRVIYYMARAFPDMEFNISKIIDALDFPSFTDRNKALVILRSIPLDNLNKEDSKRLSEILIEILEKKDAHNYKNAYTVIKKWSQKDYDENDIESWKKWAISNTEN